MKKLKFTIGKAAACLLLLCLFLLQSCRKETSFPNKKASIEHALVGAAMKWYEKNKESAAIKNTSDIIIEDYTPDWANYVIGKNSAGNDVITIPLNKNPNKVYHTEIGLVLNNDSIGEGIIKEYVDNPSKGKTVMNLYTGAGNLFMTGIYNNERRMLAVKKIYDLKQSISSRQLKPYGLMANRATNTQLGTLMMDSLDLDSNIVYSNIISPDRLTEGIQLEEVTIYGSSPSWWNLLPLYPGYEGIHPISGGGGGASAGTPATTININIEGKKVDPKEENKCFDQTKPATLTIYVQQPNENTTDKMGANSVGHVFIGIQQGSIQRLMGFYPDSPNASLISSQNSELHDNSNTLYHVSISTDIDATKLTHVINYINNYPKKYDLNNYNCSDVAIGVAAKGGLNLPQTTGSYDAVILKFQGRNPGDLGQDIRKMSLPSGVTKTTTKRNAPKKQGGC